MVKQLTITGKDLQKQMIYWIAERQPIRLSEIISWLFEIFFDFTVLIRSEARTEDSSVLDSYPQLIREMYENEGWIRCYTEGGEDVIVPLAEDTKMVLIKLTPRGNTYVRRGKNPPSRHRPPELNNGSVDEQVKSSHQNIKLKILDLVETLPSKKPRKHLTDKIARTEISRSIQGRRGQQDFRQKLLDAYQRKCAITESTIESLLEAAHIHPYCDGGPFDEPNGLLLRADIHTLFDLGLIAIDTNKMTVVIHPSLDDTEYGRYANQLITLPSDPKHHPNKAAIDQHRREADIALIEIGKPDINH